MNVVVTFFRSAALGLCREKKMGSCLSVRSSGREEHGIKESSQFQSLSIECTDRIDLPSLVGRVSKSENRTKNRG
jgi:hypothetical protein